MNLQFLLCEYFAPHQRDVLPACPRQVRCLDVPLFRLPGLADGFGVIRAAGHKVHVVRTLRLKVGEHAHGSAVRQVVKLMRLTHPGMQFRDHIERETQRSEQGSDHQPISTAQ